MFGMTVPRPRKRSDFARKPSTQQLAGSCKKRLPSVYAFLSAMTAQDAARTLNVARTRRARSRNTDTKPNFHWHHSWWWFRAQASALQQATAFLGATNRAATTIPPVPIRRNTSTLNDTIAGDRRFTSSFVSADARRRRILREPATANGPTVPPRQYFRHCS
jgi:hypothetical protein